MKEDNLEKIILNPIWAPLKEVVEHAPTSPGIYFMAFNRPIKYYKGISRIIYIGSAIFRQDDPGAAYRRLAELANRYAD